MACILECVSARRFGIPQYYDDAKRSIEIYEEGKRQPKDMRIDFGKELWSIHADNLKKQAWLIRHWLALVWMALNDDDGNIHTWVEK